MIDSNDRNHKLKQKCYINCSGEFYYLDSKFCSEAGSNKNGTNQTETLVFLHGFTGSSRDFLTLPPAITSRYRCLIPDLPGHGQTRISEDATVFQTESQVALLEQWLHELEQQQIHLFGYSMGGRLALQYAVTHRNEVRSLLLVSTTAGIRDSSGQCDRLQADWQLAEHILTTDPVDFLTEWLAQPLFQGIAALGQDYLAQEIQRRLPLQLSGLAHSLRYFSTGAMPSVWHHLPTLQMPALVIAGSQDQKYCNLANELVAAIPNATLQILDTSHAPLVESPRLLWQYVIDFLDSMKA